MTAFLDTLNDIARNLATLWPWAIVALVALAVWLLLTFPLAVAIGRAFKAGGEEFAVKEENELDRYLAAEKAAWERLRNEAEFETTAREIRALPETRTR